MLSYKSGEQAIFKEDLPAFFKSRIKTFGGFDFDFISRGTFDDDPKKRMETYERLWGEGDFKFWLATYYDMLFSKDANKEAYYFWRDKVRAHINDHRVRDIVALMDPPYAFGCKRIALEDGYFEIYNRDNVHLVDVNSVPIEEVTPAGIRTSEKEWEFDYIICATGYDAITGGLAQMDIRGSSGESLKDHWNDDVYTYLGMTAAGFPVKI
jgi:cation diffusion facilitator CzcD-associated flavoprotein CzcO